MNIGLNVEVLVNRQPAVIAFDGDDTLWVDGMREQAWERRFRHLAADRLPSNEMATRFRSLLDEFGFTVNGVQRALLLSGRECCPERLSNEWLAQVEALPELVAELDIRPKGGAADLIDHLGRAGHELWIITKGDLIRQAIKPQQGSPSRPRQWRTCNRTSRSLAG